MDKTSALMAGVTAAMLLASPGPSISQTGQSSGADEKAAPAPDRTGASDVEEVGDRISLLLARTPSDSAKTLDELLARLPGTPRDIAEQAIDGLMAEDVIHRIGDGTPASPYRYWSQRGYQS